tara:strand:- start:268 stop:384 length:117 start_codon:yes stop_codon:yes gene_type:complete
MITREALDCQQCLRYGEIADVEKDRKKKAMLQELASSN